MASNFGKFIDRFPLVRAAGKASGSNDHTQDVASCLQSRNIDSQVTALKHDSDYLDKLHFKYKLAAPQNLWHRGVYTGVRAALQPPVKTRFQTLIDDLKDTPYDSYWNKSQGKPRDPVPGLPAGMDILEATYGAPTEQGERIMINPPKTPYEVLWDSQVGHNLYQKSHNDYNPGEQVDRGYSRASFDPSKKYGVHTGADPRGILVKCACHWHNSKPITAVSSIQADTLLRQRKIKSISNTDRTFGTPNIPDLYGVADLLKEASCPPCLFKRDFHEWMANLNKLRNYLKKKRQIYGFTFGEFNKYNVYFDKGHTGWISLQHFYKVCKEHELRFDFHILEPFFKFVGVIDSDKINYRDFSFLADINSSVPEMIKIEDIPQGCKYYISTYMAAARDHLTIDNSKMPAAGVPGMRTDLRRPVAPDGGCKADLDSLGDETSMKALLSPSIYAKYGLTYRDFFMPRSPEIIRRIFENIGYKFPNDNFEKLWNVGVEHDKTGLVCVDTFKKILNETVPLPQFASRQTDL